MAPKVIAPFPNRYPITSFTEALVRSVNFTAVPPKSIETAKDAIAELSRSNVRLGEVTTQADFMFGTRNGRRADGIRPRSVVGQVVGLAHEAVAEPGTRGQAARAAARVLLCQVGIALPLSGKLEGEELRQAYKSDIAPAMDALGRWMPGDPKFAATGMLAMRYGLFEAYQDVSSFRGGDCRLLTPLEANDALNNIGTAMRATGGWPSGVRPMSLPALVLDELRATP